MKERDEPEQQSTNQSTRLHQAGRKGEDPVAFATFADIKASSTFDLRSGFKSDPWTECRSERAVYVGGWVCGGDVVEELQIDRPGED